MKVRLLTMRVGPAGKFLPGDVINVATDEGRRMIAAGQASIFEERIETATIDHRSRENRGRRPARE